MTGPNGLLLAAEGSPIGWARLLRDPRSRAFRRPWVRPGRRRPVETTSPTAGAARAAVDTLMKPTPTRNWEDVRRAVQLLAVSMRPNVSALTWRRRSRRTPEAPFPLMDLCVAALKLRRVRQDADRERTGNAWTETRLVFTTRHGMPIEPRGPRKKLGQWLGG